MVYIFTDYTNWVINVFCFSLFSLGNSHKFWARLIDSWTTEIRYNNWIDQLETYCLYISHILQIFYLYITHSTVVATTISHWNHNHISSDNFISIAPSGESLIDISHIDYKLLIYKRFIDKELPPNTIYNFLFVLFMFYFKTNLTFIPLWGNDCHLCNGTKSNSLQSITFGFVRF